MNQTATLNFFDLLVEFGTQFFRLEENDLNYYHDDLYYEDKDTEGLNGYLLKFEEQSSSYQNSFMHYLLFTWSWFISLIIKEKQKTIEDKKMKRKYYHSSHLHRSVRSRLLEVMNEDIEAWNLQSHKSRGGVGRNNRVLKNQFKSRKLE